VKNIAFVGPMHSGKTTAANYLVARYGYERVGLADQVKFLAGVLLERLYVERGLGSGFGSVSVAAINANKSVFRPFLQWLGTDYVRQYCGRENFWIEEFLDHVALTNKPVVCDDVRFPNEAEALRAAGFHIVRLHRYEEERLESIIASGGTLDTLNHPSETQLDAIWSDDDLYPDTLDALYYLIDLLMEDSDV
jgi:hypothetical protein